MPADQSFPEGQEKDSEIERNGPVLDIVEIVLDPFFQRGISPPSVDLSPSGHPRLDLVAEHIVGNLLFERLNQIGPLRSGPDKAHLSL